MSSGSVLIPIRCFTCGNLIADKYGRYREGVQEGREAAAVLNQLGIHRYCCRRMMLTSVETIQQIVPFHEAVNRRRREIDDEMQ